MVCLNPQSGLMLSCLNAAGDVEELIVGEVSYQVSIRAPINNLVGADEIAMKFGGVGRKVAAGINSITSGQFTRLSELLESIGNKHTIKSSTDK
jgi:nanoRNase/pAp phosphatase (c-di-AMP/oligoRNAs hydrolase)